MSLSPGALVALLRREIRGSAARVGFFVACLAVGVAAVVAVAGLSDGLDRAIRLQARPMLAADVSITGRRPLPPVLDDLPTELVQNAVKVRTFATMAATAAASPTSRMVDLKAVTAGYPLYGELVVEPAQDTDLHSLLGEDGVVVQPGLLRQLDLSVGDPLRLGGVDFTIRGTVTAEPDRIEASLAPSPRVFVSMAGLARTPLDTTTGRITHKLQVATPTPHAAADLVAWLETQEDVAAWTKIETWTDAQPSLRRGLSQAEAFLGLVALLSLLVGGAGVAQVIRAWLDRRLDTMATLRCLGLTPGDVQRVYLLQTLAMALLGSAVGAAAGLLVIGLVPAILGDLVPAEAIVLWQPWALVRGMLLGTGVALTFAWLPLRRARRVSPLRAIRQGVEPVAEPVAARALQAVLLTAALGGLAWAQSQDAVIAAAFTGVVVAVVGVLTVSVGGVARVLAVAARRSTRWWLRHGLSALGRPGADTLAAAVALALGVVVVLSTLLVQQQVGHVLGRGFPEDAPSAFLVDVQTHQWPDVEGILRDHSASHVRDETMVVARIAAIDGVPTETLVADKDDEARWAFTREQRLSSMDSVPPHNTVVAGSFGNDDTVYEVSLEESFAERLGVGLGTTLTFDVQGVPVPLVVTSLRKVAWESFQMNFFVIAETGPLDDAPQTRLVTFQVPESAEEPLQDALAAAHPNVTLISIRQIRDQASDILGRLGLGIQALGGFTALAGIVILFASVSAAAARRAAQVAVLKTLGTTRGGAAAMIAVEHALIGLVASIVGVVGAHVLAAVLLTQVLRMTWNPAPATTAAAIALTVCLAALAGVLGNLRALSVSPAEVLRG